MFSGFVRVASQTCDMKTQSCLDNKLLTNELPNCANVNTGKRNEIENLISPYQISGDVLFYFIKFNDMLQL